MLRKIKLFIAISLSGLLHCSTQEAREQNQSKIRDLKSELLACVSNIKPIQDIIWGYLYKWELEHSIEKDERFTNGAKSLAFSANGKYLAVYNGNIMASYVIQEIDANTGKTRKETQLTRDIHNNLIYSHDGAHMFAIDILTNKLYFLHAQTGAEVFAADTKNPISWASYSPNGTYLLLHHSDTIEIWDVKNRQFFNTLKVDRNRFFPGLFLMSGGFFSSDEKYLLTADGDKMEQKVNCKQFALQIWDIKMGEVLQRIEGHNIHIAAWSPDGKFIATDAGLGGTIQFWQQKNPRLSQKLAVVTTSEDVKNIIVGYLNWEDKEGIIPCTNSIKNSTVPNILQLIWSVDSKFLFVLGTNKYPAKILDPTITILNIYEIETGSCVHTAYDIGHEIAYAPNGSRIAIVTKDGTIQTYRNQVVDIELAKYIPVSKTPAKARSACVIS